VNELNKRGAENKASHEDRSMMKLIVRPIKVPDQKVNCLPVELDTSLLAGTIRVDVPPPTDRNRMVMRLKDLFGAMSSTWGVSRTSTRPPISTILHFVATVYNLLL
jgi:hypothetical protein